MARLLILAANLALNYLKIITIIGYAIYFTFSGKMQKLKQTYPILIKILDYGKNVISPTNANALNLTDWNI